MEYLVFNGSNHWMIRSSGQELHSGDPVRVMVGDSLIPARIQLDSATEEYVVIINGGEKIIPISPLLDIRGVMDGIL